MQVHAASETQRFIRASCAPRRTRARARIRAQQRACKCPLACTSATCPRASAPQHGGRRPAACTSTHAFAARTRRARYSCRQERSKIPFKTRNTERVALPSRKHRVIHTPVERNRHVFAGTGVIMRCSDARCAVGAVSPSLLTNRKKSASTNSFHCFNTNRAGTSLSAQPLWGTHIMAGIDPPASPKSTAAAGDASPSHPRPPCPAWFAHQKPASGRAGDVERP